MIYHLYKTDCNKASRVLMQSRWDSDFSFIHLSSNGYIKPHSRLGWKKLMGTLFQMNRSDCIIFHSQSSLPYLLLASLVKRLFFLKGVYVYDIHDFHEISPNTRYWSREFFRYFVFLIFEFLILKLKSIRKMTVSEGLAKLVAKRYYSAAPVVVKNISLPEQKSLNFANTHVSDSLVYFGSTERVPVDAMPKLNQEGFCVEIYGRGIDQNWLTNKLGSYDQSKVRFHGEYSPEDLNFLNLYKLTIIFSPQDISLNFQCSLPNKLFQALGAGLVVLVSENFEEMINLFSDVPNAVVPVNLDNICEVINFVRSHEKYCNNPELNEKIKYIQAESREFYIGITCG